MFSDYKCCKNSRIYLKTTDKRQLAATTALAGGTTKKLKNRTYDFFLDFKISNIQRSHFYEEEEVLLNGDISYELDKIIRNDTEKVNQLMAKIVIFMNKLCLKKMNLPDNGRITTYQFKVIVAF